MKLMQSTVCRVSRPWVRLVAVDQKDQGKLVSRHAEQCLRCQAETAIELRIHRELAAMGGNPMIAPAGLMPAVISGLEQPMSNHESGSGIGADKVAVAAVVVGVASVLAWTMSRWVRGGV